MRTTIFLCFVILLSSCSQSPSEWVIQTAIAETQIAQPTFLSLPSPTSTSPAQPAPTPTASPAATETATATPLPSDTPTDVLQFYYPAGCIPRNTLVQKGMVVDVGDGDDFTVQLSDGSMYEVRYIGINTPESDRPYFTEAVNANTSLINQQEVTLIKDSSDTDQFGRLLRYVIVGNVFVNLELIKMGYAKAASYPPDVACDQVFSTTEVETRAAQTGIWAATPSPQPSAPQVIITGVNKREEWVEIQNIGGGDVDLAGWNLVSERGNQECWLSGVIRMGETLRVWSGTAQGNGYSCGYSNPIWNNSETDPAVLYNPQGVEVSRK